MLQQRILHALASKSGWGLREDFDSDWAPGLVEIQVYIRPMVALDPVGQAHLVRDDSLGSATGMIWQRQVRHVGIVIT